jgi:hypothetical protein
MGLPVELSPVDLSSKVTLSEVSAVRLSICRHFVRASSEVSDVPSVDALCFFLTVCSSCPPDWLVPASRSFTCSSRCRCARCPRSTPCPGRHRRRGGAWGTCAGAGTGTASLCWPRRRKAGSGFSGHWTAGKAPCAGNEVSVKDKNGHGNLVLFVTEKSEATLRVQGNTGHPG